ncbi:hypothetical protein FRB96_002943 [Tulasnella sp. 330]|nr:hypothetical protein FRB96_002943 [Tulasnella sp. 330]KAG8879565.1 hypothetical protein FRB98_005645 [Tulasnella sp. 332]
MLRTRERASQVGKRKAGEVTDRPEQSTGKKARVESESEEEGHNDGGEEDNGGAMQKQIAEEIAAAQQSKKLEEDSAMANVEGGADVESEATKKLPTDYDMPNRSHGLWKYPVRSLRRV